VIKDGKVASTITVGKDPATPAVASDGTVYVPNGDDGTVSVLR
jgi:DNA-binding beta-propeller fold protein YncE